MKNYLFILLLCFIPGLLYAQKQTYVSVNVHGYTGKNVSFRFVEDRKLNMEFPYTEKQPLAFSVEPDDIVMMKINDWVSVCLQPGDSIFAEIFYEGTVIREVNYSGTPQAVVANQFLGRIFSMRLNRQYKETIPYALVMKTDPKQFFESSLREWKDEIAELEKVKDALPVRLYRYLLSEIEGDLLPNLLIYPYAFADCMRKNPADCLPEGYWNIMDRYEIRADDASLRNKKYISLLPVYKEYILNKEDHIPYYGPVRDPEKEYRELVGFYKGDLREVALFFLLYNSITTQKDFKTVEKLKKDYLKKYNKNKDFKKTLNEMMK